MKRTFQFLFWDTYDPRCDDDGKVIVRKTEHPADRQIDYNSIIDVLEEEHIQRQVFTTSEIHKSMAEMNLPIPERKHLNVSSNAKSGPKKKKK